MSGEELSIMDEKYRVRGAVGDNTITLEWKTPEGRTASKPATPAEVYLGHQVSSLIAALRVAMRRNAEYEKARSGVDTEEEAA